MSRDTACIVAFENDATRALVAQGWKIEIIDGDIWQSTVDGYVPSRRYIVRGRRPMAPRGTYGTMTDADTVEDAVAAFATRVEGWDGPVE